MFCIVLKSPHYVNCFRVFICRIARLRRLSCMKGWGIAFFYSQQAGFPYKATIITGLSLILFNSSVIWAKGKRNEQFRCLHYLRSFCLTEK